jgi:hypothetical protein
VSPFKVAVVDRNTLLLQAEKLFQVYRTPLQKSETPFRKIEIEKTTPFASY